jgi:hypothetical protein
LSKLKLNLKVVGFILAEDLLKVPFETIRSSDVSGSKANTLLSIAQGSISHTIPSMNEITSMKNEEITYALPKIKGIGTWTMEDLSGHFCFGCYTFVNDLDTFPTCPSFGISSRFMEYSPETE